MYNNQLKNQHLMWRSGFGPAAGQLSQLSQITPAQLYEALEVASNKKPGYIDVADDYLKGLFMGAGELNRQQLKAENRRKIRQQNRDDIKSLNLFWLNEMVDSNAQLREKMAFFWHGHFACRNINIFYQQQLLHVIRQNALGSFRTLLHEVSKSAAILNFLNANQNRKDHPNENFAREVMELFTMGRGNYTEHDVKEAARAFTGWGANLKGEFIFRKFQHDGGKKTMLGKSGNFEGEDVLDVLLAQKQTAHFITQKIYRFFVNDTVDAGHVNWLANRFYQSDYNIAQLMRDIFTSPWFYDDKNIGAKIKSPIELIVGLRRMLPMQIENEETLLALQRLLGQLLFYPPNVAGWPGGKSWIDSSTLMVRMRLPQLITDQDELNISPKTDDDQMMGMAEVTKNRRKKAYNSGGKLIDADVDWAAYTKHFDAVARENLMATIASSLLQTPLSVPEGSILKTADSSSRDRFIKTATLQLMCVPEYQMC